MIAILRTLVIVLFILLQGFGSKGQTAAIDSLKNNFASLTNAQDQLKTLNEIAKDLQAIAQYQSALDYAGQALELANILGNDKAMGVAYNTMSIVYLRMSNYPKTIEYQLKGLEIAQKRGDKKDIAASFNNIGTVYRMQGNYEEALQSHLTALKLSEEINDIEGLATSHNNTGNVYYYLNDLDATILHYEAALKMCQQMGAKSGVMILSINIGNVYLAQEKYAEALSNYLLAVDMNEQVGNNNLLADNYNNIGLVYMAQEKYDEALQTHLLSLKLKEEVGDQTGIANSYKNIGLTYAKLNQLENAKEYLMHGLAVANNLNSKPLIAGFYEGLSTIAGDAGDYVGALASYKLYVQYKDSMLNETNIEKIAELRVSYEAEKKNTEIQLLSKQNEIQYLELATKKAEIAAEQIKTMQNQQEIEMLNKVKELNLVNLELQKEELSRNQLEIQIQKDNLEITALANELKDNELKRQKEIRTAIVMGFGVLLLLGGGIASFVFYKKQLEHRHQTTVMELKVLRSQMKPHFIFNALNSVHNYIFKNNNEKAGEYLVKFSQLMRTTLNNSLTEEVSLESEIATLRNYIDLEKANLNDKFSYSVYVDEAIDMENTLVHPMIIQPFVENAIWHGVAPKASTGHITIAITMQNNTLRCTIEDNGIGRLESKKLKENSIVKEESLGIKLTKERIQIINKHCKIEDCIVFTDLETGLRVDIALPSKQEF